MRRATHGVFRLPAALSAWLLTRAARAHDLEDYDTEAFAVLSPFDGFLEGVFHPVYGPDHLLAMLSVGMLSAQMGGGAIWRVPAMFVAAMVVGGMVGMSGVAIAVTEPAIALSVVLLGLALALQARLRVSWALAFVAVFGFFHGYAHGVETPRIAEPLWFSAGFVASTAFIHLIGVAIGLLCTRRRTSARLLRLGGAIIAGSGAHFLAASLRF